MIFKLTFLERIEYITAKDRIHLAESYTNEFEGFSEIQKLEIISDENAKNIMIYNAEYNKFNHLGINEIFLFDLAIDDDFNIIASTEY